MNKMLGLLAVAAAALTACAGTASADTVTSPEGIGYTGGIHMSSVGHFVLHAGFGTIECSSTIEAKLDTHSVGNPVSGTVTTFHMTPCTGGKTVTVLKNGTFSIDVTGSNKGSFSSNGAEVTIKDDNLGVSCLYSTSNTFLGTVTGGAEGQLDLESAVIPRTGHSAFCGSSATWTGTYRINAPRPFILDIT